MANIYSNCSTLVIGCRIFDDVFLSTPSPLGFYSDGAFIYQAISESGTPFTILAAGSGFSCDDVDSSPGSGGTISTTTSTTSTTTSTSTSTTTTSTTTSTTTTSNPFDADAWQFITNASITDTTYRSAVNTLVLDLKGINTTRNPSALNLWSKFLAIYPMIGATSFAHTLNLKNPLNTDAAYRLYFGGTWTNNTSVGAIGSSNGYANTYLPPSLLNINSASVWYYRRNDPDYISELFGVLDSSGSKNGIQFQVQKSGGSNNTYSCIMSHEEGENDGGLYRTGLLGLSRTVSSGYKRYARFDGTVATTNVYSSVTGGGRTSNTSSQSNFPIYINARNVAGTTQEYSSGTCQFAAIGSGFTDAEAAVLNNIVQFCQTTLGRNVY